jgi:hypothetical protein
MLGEDNRTEREGVYFSQNKHVAQEVKVKKARCNSILIHVQSWNF